jgi:hypothetical protein
MLCIWNQYVIFHFDSVEFALDINNCVLFLDESFNLKVDRYFISSTVSNIIFILSEFLKFFLDFYGCMVSLKYKNLIKSAAETLRGYESSRWH